MSIRFYHRTGRRSAVSVGPLTALLIAPFLLAAYLLVGMVVVAYAVFWLLGQGLALALLAIAGTHRDSPWVDELAAFVNADSIRSWWLGRPDRAGRRDARRQGED